MSSSERLEDERFQRELTMTFKASENGRREKKWDLIKIVYLNTKRQLFLTLNSVSCASLHEHQLLASLKSCLASMSTSSFISPTSTTYRLTMLRDLQLNHFIDLHTQHTLCTTPSQQQQQHHYTAISQLTNNSDNFAFSQPSSVIASNGEDVRRAKILISSTY